MQDEVEFLKHKIFIANSATKTISLVIVFGLTLSFFSSCSYQIYYPQRLTVFNYDSAHQTEVITRPFMQIVGAQLGVSHSFTNHFFLEGSTQFNSTVFPLTKTPDGTSASVYTYSANAGAGFFSTNKIHNGFEIVPQFIFEHNQIYFNYYPNYLANKTPDHLIQRINFVIPALQFSYYHFPLHRTNVNLSCRFSYVFADALKNGIDLVNPPTENNFYTQNIFFEPGLQFILRKLPLVRVEAAAFVGLKNSVLKSYYAPVQLSLRINPAILKKNPDVLLDKLLKEKD